MRDCLMNSDSSMDGVRAIMSAAQRGSVDGSEPPAADLPAAVKKKWGGIHRLNTDSSGVEPDALEFILYFRFHHGFGVRG